MNEIVPTNQMSLSDLGSTLAKSGFFSDTRDAAQAIVKVLAGQELGFGPIASMTGIYVIQNRISLSANMIAAAIKRTKRYNYRVIELTDERCEIAFFEGGQEVGRSQFTGTDARKAGTKNMDKFPRNMLFARAMSNGAKWYCADIFGGPIYTPEELGANVNEDGEVIDIPSQPVKTEAPKAEPAPDPEDNRGIPAELMHLMGVCTSDGVPYPLLSNETLSGHSIGIAKLLAKNGLTPEKKHEYEVKRDAISEILAYRNK